MVLAGERDMVDGERQKIPEEITPGWTLLALLARRAGRARLIARACSSEVIACLPGRNWAKVGLS